jgi:hypothetical protein
MGRERQENVFSVNFYNEYFVISFPENTGVINEAKIEGFYSTTIVRLNAGTGLELLPGN